MYVDVQSGEIEWRQLYKLCISFINPRPIALVSTVSGDGRPNLAPFSFYNMVSANPPVVVFCPSFRRDGSPKHTLSNVRATNEFVIATVSESIAQPMAACAADLPQGESEFAFSGLTPAPASKVKPPLVAEAPVNIECRLRQIVTLSEEPGGGNVVFGDVVAIHARDELLDGDGALDPRKLHTVGRLGGQWYCTVNEPYEITVPPAS